MNRFGLFILVIAVVGSAAWAYHVNYKTRTTLDRIDILRDEIAKEREAVEVLRVEWAYLNNPDRLARLVATYSETLELQPMGPAGFDDVAAIPFPPRDPMGMEQNQMIAQDPEPEVFIVTERQPMVTQFVPLPAARPASWGSQ